MSKRETLLDAISEAIRLHQRLNSEQIVRSRGGGVDVFGAIIQLSIPLLFRPLDKLLGAFLPQPYPGIIITTQRSLAIQRFTASHELAHFILNHRGSLDDDSILNRSPFGKHTYNIVEAAADAFAASFLMPTWLFEIHAELQGWDADNLTDAHTVYQLSLRIGASYEATCRQLERYKFIDSTTLNKLLNIAPKKIKQELLGSYKLSNWLPDVWVLTDRDQGTLIQGGPNDVFLIHLKENSGAGYLWGVDELKTEGFAIVSDEVFIPDASEAVGGTVDRVLIATSQSEVAGELDLKQTRPWEVPPSSITHFTLKYDLFGRESGKPRAQRERSAAA